MQIGYIGLGKMGRNMAQRLAEKRHQIHAYDPDKRMRKAASHVGVHAVDSIADVIRALRPPRLVWIMVPHGAVNGVLRELTKYLSRGDTIIEGGNSPYAKAASRAKRLAGRGVRFLDAGVSGGPSGARNGACVMVGGRRADFKRYERLFRDISTRKGYAYVGTHGAGHFVKMVHNGIEYGMMQALAEGFAVLRTSKYKLPLTEIAELYNHKSVIESRLVDWLAQAYVEHGEALHSITGSVAHTGEGAWTVEAAKKLRVPTPIIAGALAFRVRSMRDPSYAGKVLSALRNQFGGHAAKR